MSWIAEYDTQGREFPTCVHVTKTTDNFTHGATYVPIEDGKAVRAENAKLRAARDMWQENDAKLRELARELYENECDECDKWKYRDRMRELGMEFE
jgi:hypothetical protein